MSETISFSVDEKHFGPFYPYMREESVTDVDYNGRDVWITDLKKGRYRANVMVEERFIVQFTQAIANCMNRPFNQANKVLEADTKELRISIVHASAALSGISICIRKSPPILRHTINSLIASGFVEKPVLSFLVNCVKAKMNFVFGGTPGVGKTECAKFFMQFIPKNERVITIEDSLELHYGDINPKSDYVEMRVGNGFSYTDAIKTCLRQNPQWIMLSEARSKEAAFLLEQWSTGVNGFSTIHVKDLSELPERLLNMMHDEKDIRHMENRIYQFVNLGVLIRCMKTPDRTLFRYIDQVYFFVREDGENKIYPMVEAGKVISDVIPLKMKKQFEQAGIENPFVCEEVNVGLEKEKGGFYGKNPLIKAAQS